MERRYPRCQFSESFFVRQCFAYRVTDRAIIDFNRTIVDIFANYSVRYMIRLKGMIILFFRIIKFSFHLARIRDSFIQWVRCPCDNGKLVCRILHRLVLYITRSRSVYFFTIARSPFVFLHALFNHLSLVLVPRSVSRNKSRFKSNVTQRRKFAKLIKFGFKSDWITIRKGEEKAI